MAHRYSRKKKIVISVILTLLVASGYYCWRRFIYTSAGLITISKETTYITGPVNDDGTVNYTAHINAKYSEGVTPENNACIPILQALGPDALPDSIKNKSEYYKRLKMQPLEKEGNYFHSLYDYVRLHDLKDPAPVPRAKPNNSDKSGANKKPNKSLIENRITIEQFDKAMTGPWDKKDHPEIAAWLQAITKPLDLIIVASNKPEYYFPLLSPTDPPMVIEVIISPVTAIRTASRALVARAMMRFGSGDADAAFADLMAVRRISRLITSEPSLVSALVGLGCDASGQMGCEVLSTSEKLTSKQARSMLAEMQELETFPSIFPSIQMERLIWLDAAMSLKRNRNPRDNTFDTKIHVPRDVDWDIVLRSINEFHDKMAVPWKIPAFAKRKQAFYLLEKEWFSQLDDNSKSDRLVETILGTYPSNQSLADQLTIEVYPVVSRASLLWDRNIMHTRLDIVVMALAASYADTNKYPASLSELCPKYLQALPIDLYTDKPLIYRLTEKGYLLYSVGENATDDGGVYDHKDGDIAVQIGAKSPNDE